VCTTMALCACCTASTLMQVQRAPDLHQVLLTVAGSRSALYGCKWAAGKGSWLLLSMQHLSGVVHRLIITTSGHLCAGVERCRVTQPEAACTHRALAVVGRA
jgi:hypothetical protein